MLKIISLLLLSILAGCAGTSTGECLTCSTYVYNGHVYRRAGFGSEIEKNQVARSFCAERGMYGEPELGPPIRWAEGFYYRINCPRPQPLTPVLPVMPQLPTKSPEKPVEEASFEKLKGKCSDLGFKPGTEQFGNCVLQLSK